MYLKSNSIRLALWAAALLSLYAWGAAQAVTFTVDRVDDNSFSVACDPAVPLDCSLRGAVIASNLTPGEHTIVIPADRFVLSLAGRDEDAAQTGDLDIQKRVTVMGAGQGATIIDGGGASGLGDRILHLLPGSRLELSELTITGGSSVVFGSGIENWKGELSLNRVTLEGNEAERAGALHNQEGLVHVRNSRLAANRAAFGAAIDNCGTLVLQNSRVTANESSGQGTFGGGAIVAVCGTLLSISNSFIDNNSILNRSGGAIYVDTEMFITESQITANHVSGDTGQQGGGIYANQSADVTLIRSTIDGNTVAANGQGGGIWNRGSARIVNSTVSGNRIGNGLSGSAGGIFNDPVATLELTHTTVAQNRALVANALGIRGSVTIANSVIHSPIPGAEACSGDTATSLGGNVESVDPQDGFIGGDRCGFDQASDQVNVLQTELNLGALADNGGPTPTHALLASSVAIDAGNESQCEERDQRNLVRADGLCDSGAFELDAQPPADGVFVDGFESKQK